MQNFAIGVLPFSTWRQRACGVPCPIVLFFVSAIRFLTLITSFPFWGYCLSFAIPVRSVLLFNSCNGDARRESKDGFPLSNWNHWTFYWPYVECFLKEEWVWSPSWRNKLHWEGNIFGRDKNNPVNSKRYKCVAKGYTYCSLFYRKRSPMLNAFVFTGCLPGAVILGCYLQYIDESSEVEDYQVQNLNELKSAVKMIALTNLSFTTRCLDL